MKKWNVTVEENGLVRFPPELWQAMRVATGVRSKKYRIIKKSIKKLLIKTLLEMAAKQ